MDEIKQQLKALVVPLLLIALLGFGSYWFIAALIDKLNSVNSDIGKAIIAGAATIIVTVLSLVAGKIWEQKIKIRQDIRDKKIPVYEQQMIKAFSTFTEKLIIWGDPLVIKAWSEFRLNADPKQFLIKWQSFLMALRKDIGNSNANLEGGDLMRLFINDYGAEVPAQILEASVTPTG